MGSYDKPSHPYTASTSKAEHRNPKKVATFRTLVKILILSGWNVWDARIEARKMLKLKQVTTIPVKGRD